MQSVIRRLALSFNDLAQLGWWHGLSRARIRNYLTQLAISHQYLHVVQLEYGEQAKICQKWSSCTTTTPGNPKEPLSKVGSSISCGVLSIKTSRMLQSIWIVVPRTSTEKRTRQNKSSICHLGLYQIMALAIMTPTLCIRSPNTRRYAPCTMLLSWCCFCCLHLLLLPDKTQVIITLFAFSKDYAKSWLPWASASSSWWSANLMLG